MLMIFGHAVRLTRAAFVLAREGAFADIDARVLPGPARPPLALAKLIARRGVSSAQGLAHAIDRLGPSYVKLGQFLATRPDIVGPKVAAELERLQDRMAPASREFAVARIEAAFDRPIDEVFLE